MAVAISDEIEGIIEKAISNFDGNVKLDDSFENLISLGELVDRISVINFKLFKLKDEVMKRSDAVKWVHESEKPAFDEFSSWASVEDVKLCKERSRLKRCIDEKVLAIIGRVLGGEKDGGFISETKLYGGEQ